jgi:hypothetical protein
MPDMGSEAKGKLHLGRYTFAGTAQLESDRLVFRGETRFALPLKEVRAAEVDADGDLRITHGAGEVALSIEPASLATKWARKIANPRTRADKLGLQPGQRVVVLGVDDADFLAETTTRLGAAPLRRLADELDLIFHAADSAEELRLLAKLKTHLQPAGAIWVVSRKGKEATVKDVDVMRAAKAAGLVDNKVCSFSETHTALRLVIPRAQR